MGLDERRRDSFLIMPSCLVKKLEKLRLALRDLYFIDCNQLSILLGMLQESGR